MFKFLKNLSSTNVICIIGLLWSLTLAFKYLSIFVPFFGTKITLEFLPIIFIGMFLGPIIGALSGAILDFLGFVLFPSVFPYFWMYTLQSSLFGFLAGVFSYGGKWFFSFDNKKQIQVMKIWLFFLFLITFVLCFINIKTSNNFFYLFLIILVLCPFLIVHVFSWFWKKHDQKNLHVFLYVSIVVTTISCICSFWLGTHITGLYIQKFLSHNYLFEKSNSYFWLLFSRLLKESIKMPIIIFILSRLLISVRSLGKNNLIFKEKFFNFY